MTQDSRFARLDDTDSHDGEEVALVRRLFVFEGGWRAGVKTGSHREFCHMMAPGQDFYHRLVDGEIFLIRDSEKVCLPCAARRGSSRSSARSSATWSWPCPQTWKPFLSTSMHVASALS